MMDSYFRRGDRESIDECRKIAQKFLGNKINSHEVYDTKSGGNNTPTKNIPVNIIPDKYYPSILSLSLISLSIYPNPSISFKY